MSVTSLRDYGSANSNTTLLPSTGGSLATSSVPSSLTSTLQSGGLAAPIPGYSSSTASHAVQADFNGDGQEDILWRNYTTGQNVVWFMNGTSRVSVSSLDTVADLNWRIQAVNDFNGDGRADILWRNYATGQNVVWAMNGISRVSVGAVTAVDTLSWQIQGSGDFNGDGRADILWRNYATGQNVIWAMDGLTLRSTLSLPNVVGSNLRIQGAADFNGDGSTDIVWRNYLSGENFIWSMNGAVVTNTTYLPTVPAAGWEIRGTGDFNNDSKTDLLWRNSVTGQNLVWVIDNLALVRTEALETLNALTWQIAEQDVFTAQNPLAIANFSFSGQETDVGTFQIRLNQAPTAPVNVTLVGGDFVSVDADGTLVNGSQSTITFTPSNWNQPRTLLFVAEADGSSSDRRTNTITYSLSGGQAGSGAFNLGTVTNTYAPDPTQFNIDLDFRNDYFGFWTPARRVIAQRAANDWAAMIANEWSDFVLNNSISRLETSPGRPYSFISRRYVDDVLIFVNPYVGSTSGNEPAVGGPDYDFGGWADSPSSYGLMPRVGQIAISPTVFANVSDTTLYQAVSHEIGHVLGLVGLNWQGALQQNLSSRQTATFQGPFATAAYGANIPLQSQNGGDFYHPADGVYSIMSYYYIYRVPGPTQIDFAMLADSGYRVRGFNA
jgi:hypothetical protein